MTRPVSQVTALDAPAGSYEALVTVGAKTDRVQFHADGPFGNDDALLPLALEPAMRVGGVLELPLGLSPSMQSSCVKIQDLLLSWSDRPKVPPFERVDVQAAERHDGPADTDRGVGAFFTGGVDSTYTALKHHDEITHLIFVDRFDIPYVSAKARSAALAFTRSTARSLDKTLIEVETNLRDFSDQWVSWEFYHGAALATVALLLSPQLSRIYVPSTFAYNVLAPWGSHPALDPLWGTDEMTIVHDGTEADRYQKIVAIGEHPERLSRLRVCWQYPGDTEETQNCGRCEKCTRTMLALWRCGRLEAASSLPNEINLRAVALTKLDLRAVRAQWQDALVHAVKGREWALAGALGLAILRAPFTIGRGLVKRELRRSPTVLRLVRRLRAERSRLLGRQSAKAPEAVSRAGQDQGVSER